MRNIRGRRIAALALSLVLACSLSACGLSNQSDVTTLAADENGKLTHTIVESVGNDGTEQELTAYIKEQIKGTEDADSSSASGGSISLESCKIRGGRATIVMEYSSYREYEDFNRTGCFLGTISQAETAGYDVTGQTFYDEKGNPAENQEEIRQRANDWKVLIFEEPMNVRLPDKILYTTSALEVTGRLTASWKKEAENAASASVSVSGASVSDSSSGTGGAENVSGKFEPETGTLTYVIFK